MPKKKILIQVSKHFDMQDLENRETRSLLVAAKEQKQPFKLIIVTQRDKFDLKQGSSRIKVVPLYEWLLKN